MCAAIGFTEKWFLLRKCRTVTYWPVAALLVKRHRVAATPPRRDVTCANRVVLLTVILLQIIIHGILLLLFLLNSYLQPLKQQPSYHLCDHRTRTLVEPFPMLLLRACSSPRTAASAPRLLIPPLCRWFSSAPASPPMTWGVCDYGRLGHGGVNAASAWRWAAVDALEPAPVALALTPPSTVTAASCGEACVRCAASPCPRSHTSSCPAGTRCSWTPAEQPGQRDSTKGSPARLPLQSKTPFLFLRPIIASYIPPLHTLFPTFPLQRPTRHWQHSKRITAPARHPEAPRRLPLRWRRALRHTHS